MHKNLKKQFNNKITITTILYNTILLHAHTHTQTSHYLIDSFCKPVGVNLAALAPFFKGI